MKKYINIFITLLVLAVITITCKLYIQNNNLKRELSIAVMNEKALLSENSLLENKSRGLQFTVEQLEYFNDSLIVKMNEMRRTLKIKDKDLKQLQYLLSEGHRVDTLILKDTIFSDPTINIDTLVGDSWYQLKLGLRYPSTIIAEPKFVSEKFIIVSYSKETINPPKKCAIARLFQRKHKVVEVEVVECNPYMESKQQRFIEVLSK